MNYTEYPEPSRKYHQAGMGECEVVPNYTDRLAIAQINAQNETNRLLAELITRLEEA